jgi:hypothetical protein
VGAAVALAAAQLETAREAGRVPGLAAVVVDDQMVL